MSDTSPLETTPRSTRARRVPAVVLALAPIIALVVFGAIAAPNLDRRMATHWSVSGAPDQFGDTVAMVWIFGSLVAALTVAAIVVLAVGALVPRGNREHPPADAVSPLPLRPGERVAWVGTAGSRIFAIGGILITIVCAAVGTVNLASAQFGVGQSDASSGPIIALTVGVFAGLSVVVLARVRLFIDSRGVRLVSAIFGVPLMRIRLADVAGVRVEMIEPARWGGWGYRFSSAGRAYVTRRRPGIVVTTHRGGASAVTIDNASGAASVLQALLDR